MFTNKKQRALQEIELRRNRIETYIEPLPIDTATDITEFLNYFYRTILFSKNNTIIQNELNLYTNSVGKYYNIYVLQEKSISYEDFWQRYYYRTSSIERVIYELEQNDIAEKKKKNQNNHNKFSWRSGSSSNTNDVTTTTTVNDSNSATNAAATTTTSTTTSTTSLADLIPQRVLSTSPVTTKSKTANTTTTNSNNNNTRGSGIFSSSKKIIFNDLLPKRKSSRSNSNSLSPAVSKDQDDTATVITSNITGTTNHNNSQQQAAAVTTTFVPPPIQPIILDLHDEDDKDKKETIDATTTASTTSTSTIIAINTDIVKTNTENSITTTIGTDTSTPITTNVSTTVSFENDDDVNRNNNDNTIATIPLVVGSDQNNDSNNNFNDDVVVPLNGTDDGTTKIDISSISVRNINNNVRIVSDSEQINNNNNIPDDEVDEEDDLVDAAITHVTSSSSMDVVDHIIDNVVEVVPKPKFFSTTTNSNDDETKLDDTVDDETDNNNNDIQQNDVPVENSNTSTTGTATTDVINTMSELKTEINNDEVVNAVDFDSINISNDNIVSTLDDVVLPDLDVPTVVNNIHQTIETNVIDNTVANDMNIAVDQIDVTTGSTIVPSMIENLKNSNVDDFAAKQEEHHHQQQERNLVDTKNNHLNIIEEVTNLCCNNSNDVMNDDYDDTTTNQFTETVMEITNTIISDCIQSTPLPSSTLQDDATINNDTSNVIVDTNVQQNETFTMESNLVDVKNDVVSVVNDNNTGITKDVVSSAEIYSNNNSNNLSNVQARDIGENNNNINSQDERNVVDNEITSNVVENEKETVESSVQISDTPSDLPTTTEKVGNDVSTIKEDDAINAIPIDTILNDNELQMDVPIVSSLTVNPPNNIQEQIIFTEPAISNPPFTDDDFIHAIQNSNDLASSTDEDFPIPSPNETKLDNILEHVVELSSMESVLRPSAKNDDITNEIENQGIEGVKHFGNSRDIPIDTSTGHLEEILIVDDSNVVKEEKNSNDNLSLEPTNGKGVSETVAALMVELPKQVPTNTNDLPEVNEKAVPFSNTYNVPTESDGAFPVVNPFDEVLSMDAVSKVDSLSTFNETIDSMPLTPDVFQSWETENESLMVNTPMMPELLNSNTTDAFDPFAVDTIANIPKEDISEQLVAITKTDPSIAGVIETINTSTTHDSKPNSEYSSSLFSNDELEKASEIETTETQTTTEAMQVTMESVDKMIDDVFNVKSNERNGFDLEDNSNVTAVLSTVEQTVNDIDELDPDVATLQTTEIRSKGDMDDINKPMDGTSVKNDSSSGFSAIGKIIRSLSSDSTKVTTDSEKAPAIGLGRRFGELFGSKKRKQSIEEDESLETLDGFHSPKIAKHTCFLDDSKVNSVPVDLSMDSVVKHSDISQEIEESAVLDPIDIQGFKSISDKLEDITLQGEGMESTEPTCNEQTGLSEVVVGKGLIVEEVAKTVIQDGTDSRSVTPVTSNVDLTSMERNVDVEELDRPNGIGLESHRSPFRYVLIIMIGIVISIVVKYWPSITMMTVPVIDDLCGPVKPGWSSTDYPNNTSMIIEEAPYWVPNLRGNDDSRTNWKRHVFQIICGTNRTRTVLRLTPANVKQQLYYFELWEATDNDDDVQINIQKNTEPLISKMKIRSVQVLPTTPNQIEIVRPRGKIDIYPSYWSKK